MQTVVIVIHLMLVLALIGAVLLQRSEGGGFASGSNSGFLSSRGTANVLTRTTAILAGGFFLTSLILSILAGIGRAPTSILGPTPTSQEVPGGATPVTPTGEGGVLNAIRGAPDTPQAPPASPAPSGPQVPQSK